MTGNMEATIKETILRPGDPLFDAGPVPGLRRMQGMIRRTVWTYSQAWHTEWVVLDTFVHYMRPDLTEAQMVAWPGFSGIASLTVFEPPRVWGAPLLEHVHWLDREDAWTST